MSKFTDIVHQMETNRTQIRHLSYFYQFNHTTQGTDVAPQIPDTIEIQGHTLLRI